MCGSVSSAQRLAFVAHTLQLTPRPVCLCASGLVIATPTSLKSFALKFLELSRELANLPLDDAPARFMGVPLGRRRFGADRERTAIETQLKVCMQVLRLWRGGAMMLDEVDWLLHPLKSELNWPLGECEPLDFTKSSVGPGLRWKLPFQLFDLVLTAAEGSASSTADAISKEMMACVTLLQEAFARGRQQHELQVRPCTPRAHGTCLPAHWVANLPTVMRTW